MELFLKILFAIPSLAFIYFFIAIFIPGKFKLSRSAIFETDKDLVYPWLENLETWPEWVNWLKSKNHNTEISFKGEKKGSGSVLFWKSKTMGRGSIEIISADHEDGIHYKMLIEGSHFNTLGKISLYETQGVTRVNWSLSGNVGWRLSARYFKILFKRSLKKDIDLSLILLKTQIEQNDADQPAV